MTTTIKLYLRYMIISLYKVHKICVLCARLLHVRHVFYRVKGDNYVGDINNSVTIFLNEHSNVADASTFMRQCKLGFESVRWVRLQSPFKKIVTELLISPLYLPSPYIKFLDAIQFIFTK